MAQKMEKEPKITKEYVKDLQNITKKCDLSAKQAELLLNISLKVKIPPERVAATIVMQDYENLMSVQNLESYAKINEKGKKIMGIIDIISSKVWDSSQRGFVREIKTEYIDLYNKLMEKVDYFKDKYAYSG